MNGLLQEAPSCVSFSPSGTAGVELGQSAPGCPFLEHGGYLQVLLTRDPCLVSLGKG